MLKTAKALGLAGQVAAKAMGGAASATGGMGLFAANAQNMAGMASAAAEATPKSLGYTMPGEFEPHVGCWMGWPYSPYLWREDAKPAQQQYAAIAKAISQFEPVWMFADPSSIQSARNHFRGVSGVTVVEMPLEDGWLRDWGPTCVVRDDPKTGKREVAGVHWDYDCYGAPGKKKLGLPAMMPEWQKDHAAGRAVLDWAGIKAFECPLHLEGGSIHSDGQGTLVVTEECLLHPSRNPHLGKEGIEKMLKEYLGLEKIIWLWKGMMGDDHVVNGHVDNMATFTEPGTILLSWCDDPNDPQHEVSARNLEILENTEDALGRRLKVIKLPAPSPAMFRTFKEANGMHPDHVKKGYVPRVPGERLAASYINHYIANGGIVCPQFGGAQSKSDEQALEILSKAYPGRKVVGVYSRDVLLNAGNVHCITQQHVAPRG
ncbi:hypothetical protein HYH02_013709 [Chlamydomonas schloesseri]|uniref:Agmatine deiminase n=1 Tax=Chlamydomonas schloesseri TaxID=2026947 RepID=A0A835VWD4_9CHLO|nr:hypothetical protein HYH02_013709 [Chlamydomonas schloesseri]|eukprot:KAG2430345.1 hypothetical protein HYH02_013709 [Chlamydomonas schloesseri]